VSSARSSGLRSGGWCWSRGAQREVAARLGLARDTVAKAVRCETPPKYSRVHAGSKLAPFKDWICERLREDPGIPSQRLREMAGELGDGGRTTILTTMFVSCARGSGSDGTFQQRTIYRPGEVGAVRSMGAARAGAGRSWSDEAGLGSDRRVVLVAGDRRCVDLLQGGAGHLVGRRSLP
jgi:hypothetical protein